MATTASNLDNLNEIPVEVGAITRQPRNLNQLNAVAFRLVFNRMPEIEYSCQSVSIPSLILGGPVLVPTPLSDTPNPGDKITFDNLTINFIVDEDLSNYKEVYSWITGLGFPESFDQFTQLDELTSDATVITLTNNMQPNAQFKFRDCFPVSLGNIDFSTTNTDMDPIVVGASFSFSGVFDIVKLNDPNI